MSTDRAVAHASESSRLPDGDESTSNDRAGRASVDGALYVAGRLVAQILEFVLWVVAARRLELAEVGALAIVLLASRYAGFLGDWGANFTGPREVAKQGIASAAVGNLIRRRELATLAASFAFVVGVLLFGYAALWPLLGQVLYRGLNRDWISLATGRPLRAVSAAVAGHATALMLGLTLPASTIPAAFGIGGLVGLVLSIGLNPRPVSRRGPASAVKADGWYVIAGLAGLTYTTADTFLLGALRSADEVAIYASVYRLPNAWLLLIGLAVGAAVPRVAAHVANHPDRRVAVRRRMTRSACAGVAVVAIATPVALWLSPVLFGPSFADGRTPLLILMAATAVVTFGAPFQVLSIADGNDRTAAIVMAAAAGVNVIANLAVIPVWGMSGAAWTTVTTQALPAVYYWFSTTSSAREGSQPGRLFREHSGDRPLPDSGESQPD